MLTLFKAKLAALVVAVGVSVVCPYPKKKIVRHPKALRSCTVGIERLDLTFLYEEKKHSSNL